MTNIDFNQEVLPLCRCIKIIPKVASIPTLGFTDLDFDVVFDGVTYKSMPGFDVTATDASVDLSSNNSEIRVLIEDPQLNPRLIEAGFFENAEVEVFMFDYVQGEPQDPYIISTGELGQTTGTDNQYKVEMMSLENKLNKGRTKKVSIFCDYDFGDSDCLLSLTPFTLAAVTITAIVDDYTYTLSATPSFNASFGKIRFLGGELNQLSFDIFKQSGANIILYEKLPITPQIGDSVTITGGCNKTVADCKSFNNFVNYGGVPSGGNWVRGRDNIYNPVIDRQ